MSAAPAQSRRTRPRSANRAPEKSRERTLKFLVAKISTLIEAPAEARQNGALPTPVLEYGGWSTPSAKTLSFFAHGSTANKGDRWCTHTLGCGGEIKAK